MISPLQAGGGQSVCFASPSHQQQGRSKGLQKEPGSWQKVSKQAKRIATAGYCIYQLGTFWGRAALDRKTKLHMYESLITAKLMYALEVAPKQQGERSKLEGAFFKGLRQIRGWKTTHGQLVTGAAWTNINEGILREAGEALSRRESNGE